MKAVLVIDQGSYDDPKSYAALNEAVTKLEVGFPFSDRIFYMALPPSVFAAASNGLKHHLYTATGTNRIVVEKPFGKDTESSHELSVILAKNWHEDEIYRIDHYLGKEMVKNLMVLR
jgi:glucose-6-phosphate 1-dehydrogenase